MQYVSVIGGLLIDLPGSPAASLAAVSSLIGAPPPPIGQSRGFPPPHQSLELLLLLIHFVMPWDHLSSLPPNIFIKYLLHIAKQAVNVDIHSRKVMLSNWIAISWPRTHGLEIFLFAVSAMYSIHTFSVNFTEHPLIATDLRESSSTKLHRLRLSV